MAKDQDWSWIGEDGVEHSLEEDELTFALTSEEIPAYTLVSKRGWGEWLPATQVSELSWALPAGHADAPRKPSLSESGARAAPPLETYPTLKFRAQEIAAGRINPQFETALNLSPSAPPTARRPSEPSAPGLASSAALGSSPSPASAPGSSPPSSEGPRLSAYSASDGEEPTVQIEATALQTELSDEQQDGPKRGSSLPPLPRPPAGGYSAPSTSVTSPAARASGETLGPATWPRKAAPRAFKPRLRPAAVALGVLAGGACAWFVFSEKAETEQPEVAAAPAPSPQPLAPTPSVVECQVVAGPSELWEFANPQVRITLGPSPRSGYVAMGFGQTSRYAMGVLVDASALKVEKFFTKYQDSPLLTVTPLVRSDQLEFRVERAASTLQSTTTIDAPSAYGLGFTQRQLAVRHPGKKHEALWTSTWETFSIPSTASLGSGLYGAAFRGGGERGSALMARLTASGGLKEPPIELKVEAARVGSPELATGEGRSYVLVEGGPTASKGQLNMGQAELPAMPRSASVRVATPEQATEPRLTVLGKLGVAIQWTGGSPGSQHVMMKVLSPALDNPGATVQVSPAGRDCHGGALYPLVGDKLLTVYMVRNGQNHELWGSVLRCN